ncbi:MAG: T9SS type A sorting domain-containing protein [Saprospiraceae bacterium]|nr:T9SS type A sorting domain-containing protein [Saprospiraceae bacterium]
MAYTNGMPLTNKITSDQDIEYLIRFQNTGTDTAFKVVIRDQLDKNLDWNSFEVLSSSHPYSFTMDDGGLVTFLFKDILLPDSSINVVASNGYIKYSIKQKDNIALGTVIHNEAAIYFDYNEPVWTNKVSLQLVSPSKTKNYSQDILLTIVPNPFSTRASISLPKELEDQEKLIKIFDLHGKEIMQYRSMEKSIELVNDHFRNGVYLIKVFAKNGRTGIAKFVVKK